MNGGSATPGFVRGSEITADLHLETDVAIVGSGPGGAITAFQLAAAGAKVIVLEEGGYHTRPEFKMQESWSYPHLYQDQGSRATDDQSILVLQGRSIGGGTTVNWTTSYRTPDSTLRHWALVKGVRDLTRRELDPHWEEIERRLNILPVTPDQVNPNNDVLWRGGRKLGFGVELLRRNVADCMQTGYCGMGCPVDAKQAMHLTYLPDAVRKGAVIYADCRVGRLEFRGRRIVEAQADVLDGETGRPTGRRVGIRARTFVVSGGAINTPRLLLQSDLPDPHRRAGKATWIHPVVATAGLFDRPIEPYYGVPQSVASRHFAVREGKIGFFIETPPVHPMLAGIALSGFGPAHRELMKALPRTGVLIGLLIDGFLSSEAGGTVSLRHDGRVSFDYPLSNSHHEAMREAMKAMARIQFAAGAREVVTFHDPPLRLRSAEDVARIDEAPLGPNRCAVFTAHAMGGAAMGEDPRSSVVDSGLKHHHLDNLYVIDGSVFPTSLGVNPQLSILGISSLAATRLAAGRLSSPR